MENCIFCKIANGEIPATTLYEDEDFRVILEEGNIVIKIGDWIPEGVSGAIVPDLGAVRRTRKI